MNLNQTQKKTNFIWQTLVLQNCWPVSQPVKFSSKKITQYLLGSRTSMNVFKYDQLRHLLLKLSPLIRTLFQSQLRIQNKVGRYTYYVPPTPPRDPNKLAEWKKRMKASNQLNRKFKRKRHYYKTIEKAKPIKVLFATINPIYSEIIESAANLCNMSFHTNRWLCGSLTANARYLKDRIQLETPTRESDNLSKVHFQFFKKYNTNKEVPEKRYTWHQLQKKSKRPTIVIIPDIHNNDMILRETHPLNIPVIGLVNSSCATEVTYPIFGNANSLEIVHFFCHFLAVLIAKEVVQQDYKNKSHRTFARARWVLQKDSIKIPPKFFKDRQTKLSNRRPTRLQRPSQNHSQYVNKNKLQILQKKRWMKKLSLRKHQIKHRIWKKSKFQYKNIWKNHNKLGVRKHSFEQKKVKPNSLQKHLKKPQGEVLSLRLFFYPNLDLKKKRIYGRRQAQKRKLRKHRKQMNNIAGSRYFVQKNAHHLIFGRQYYPNFNNWNWKAGKWTTLNVTHRLLLIFLKSNFNKKKISKFFRKNSSLTYLAYNFLQQASKTRFRDSRRALFFEFYTNQKRNQSIPFSLPIWKQELLTTNESIWRNAYGNYLRTRDKKKRIKAFGRRSFKDKDKKKNLRFRGKIRSIRMNQPYHWRSTKTLITKHQIKSLTRLWTKTQYHIYRDIQKEFWTQVAWYFDKKKRRKVWVKWRLHERLQQLDSRVKYPKPQKYKTRWSWAQKNAQFKSNPHKKNFKNNTQSRGKHKDLNQSPKWLKRQSSESRRKKHNND